MAWDDRRVVDIGSGLREHIADHNDQRRRMLDADINAAPADRVAQSALLITGEDDKRNALCLDGPELRYGQLPLSEYLKYPRLLIPSQLQPNPRVVGFLAPRVGLLDIHGIQHCSRLRYAAHSK